MFRISEYSSQKLYIYLNTFQTKLFEEFPDESGIKDPSLRSLPFLPGKIIFGRSNIRDVAEKRKEPINEYCQVGFETCAVNWLVNIFGL